MHRLILIFVLIAIVHAFHNQLDTSREYLTRRIFSRSPGDKRRLSDSGSAGRENGNKRQRQAADPSYQAAGPSRPTRPQRQQPPVGSARHEYQKASTTPVQRYDRDQAGVPRTKSRSPFPPSPNRIPRSSSKNGSHSPPSAERGQHALSGSSGTTSSSPPNQSSDRHSPRTSLETTGRPRRGALSASHSDEAHSTDSQRSRDTASTSSSWGSSSAASTPRRINPVFASMITTGPATVSVWKGRTRSEMQDPIYIPEGKQKLIDGSNARSVVMSAQHHSAEASTHVTGTGRKVGIDARFGHTREPISTTVRVPGPGGNTLQGDKLRHTTPTHPQFYGSQLEALVTGHGVVDVEARNPGSQSSSDLDF